MNYLAHLLLSNPDEDEMTGNFIGDYVKGRNYTNYPGALARGIFLHRTIDNFVDHHDVYHNMMVKFRPVYGLYANAITDIALDHILAVNWNEYCPNETLEGFSNKVYNGLNHRFDILPAKVQGFLHILISHRRLQSYASITSLEEVFEILTLRRNLPDEAAGAVKIIQKNLCFFETGLATLWPELQVKVGEARRLYLLEH